MSSGSAVARRLPPSTAAVSSTTAFGAATRADRRAGLVEHRHALRQLEVADVQIVSDRQRRHVDVDVIGDLRRVDAEVHLVHRLLENAAGLRARRRALP